MRWIITVKPGPDVWEVSSALEEVGAVVEKTRPITGIISVEVDSQKQADLMTRIQGMPGVIAIEREGSVQPSE